jgi:hypothetical protein
VIGPQPTVTLIGRNRYQVFDLEKHDRFIEPNLRSEFATNPEWVGVVQGKDALALGWHAGASRVIDCVPE